MDLQLMTPRPFVSSFPARLTSLPILVAPPKQEKVAPKAPEKRQPRYKANQSRKAKRKRDRKKVPYVPQTCRHQVTILQTKEQSKGKTAFERMMADEKRGRTAKNWNQRKGHNPCKAHSFKARNRRIAKKAKAPKKPIIDRGEKRSAYLDYLKTDLWCERIRPRVIQRDGHKCRTCNAKKRLQVHHRSYARAVMLGQDDTQLITLCRTCHLKIEFVTYDENDTTKQVKRSRDEVEARLNDLLGQAARIRNVPAAE